MDLYARATIGRRASAAVAVLASIACALVLGGLLASPNARAASTASLSDAQLDRTVTGREADAARIGEELLVAESHHDAILRERDAARAMLGAALAEIYKHGSSGDGLVTQMLSASSVADLADRVRIAHTVSAHHANILRAIDKAEARFQVGEVRRAELVLRLGEIQDELVLLHAEQEQRAQARTARAARAASKARAAAARRAATSGPGTLVGTTGAASGGIMPFGSFVASTGPPNAAGIDSYLARKGSPMVGTGAAFLASGSRWGVDPRLVVAIAGAESSFGVNTCGPFNAWGWACPNDPASFADWPTGIETISRGLRNYYLDEGRTSVALIQQKYCPVGAANDPTGLNSHWAQNVTRFLTEQGGNPHNVGPGPAGGVVLPDFGGLGFGTGD